MLVFALVCMFVIGLLTGVIATISTVVSLEMKEERKRNHPSSPDFEYANRNRANISPN